MKRKEQALLYGFNDEERIRAVRWALDRTSVPSRILPPEAHHQKIGYLIGMKGFRVTPPDEDEEDFSDPDENFTDFSDEDEDYLDDEYTLDDEEDFE